MVAVALLLLQFVRKRLCSVAGNSLLRLRHRSCCCCEEVGGGGGGDDDDDNTVNDDDIGDNKVVVVDDENHLDDNADVCGDANLPWLKNRSLDTVAVALGATFNDDNRRREDIAILEKNAAVYIYFYI